MFSGELKKSLLQTLGTYDIRSNLVTEATVTTREEAPVVSHERRPLLVN